ncbi:MAG: PD-(D/E)XK nuclease family protein [Firmicutes bacterium]|nr:PD-(D/E)XK nuclease family protein [Bacillota bacterium]HOB34524.1 PD-(D/E)XK nuclease family protein [Bacillota bacterium]HPZ90560.1 PD-(D/E)XK nuclease family protein [Bacillota bacterium]HQE02387.1 PD-(D/E)XK nuclease family protein [Bacillota bacterium]
MQSNLDTLWFSQASLSAWLTCPLKFKYRYIDGLYWPMAAGSEAGQHIEQGRKFHLLAQYYFGSGNTQAPDDEPLLRQWLQRLAEFLPLTGARQFLPEYELRSVRDGIRLLAKFDLLACDERAITVYDWKTDAKPPAPALAGAVQTRVYLYLLSQAGHFARRPEDLQMVYWNPRFPDQPLAVGYSREKQQADWAWLRELIAQIRSASAFPATSDEMNCRHCEYRPVCHGQSLEEAAPNGLDWEEVNWDEIEEIALQGVNMP